MLLNRWQTTLQKAVSFTGKGLHSGRVVQMTVNPAPANRGIVFLRGDIPHSKPIIAQADQITCTALCTKLGQGSQSVATIEHLMAAFAGLGIRNAIVHVDAPELPIMDGSSAEFVRAFMRVGLLDQEAPAKAYRLKRSLVIEEGDKKLRLEPSERQRIKCSIDFKTRVIGSQSIDYRESLENFLTIADARTFCHLNDVQSMHEKGLALGGGLDNAIVVTEFGVLNESGLRVQDEFVRHKLLDLIGDFSLLGAPLLAEIFAYKSGHALHARAVQTLLSQKDIYLEEFYPSIEDVAFAGELSQAKTSAAALVSYA